MNSDQTNQPHKYTSIIMQRLNQFYILAFIPLLLVFYFNPFSVVIPFYGFLLLLLKSYKLSNLKTANLPQKTIGIIVIAASFFAHYAVVFIYPNPALYGPANYAPYLLGLFLFFFEFPALKEAFAPLFLIVAATSSTFLAAGLKPYIEPSANTLAYIIVDILRILGVNARTYNLGSTPVVTFTSISGSAVFGLFAYECIGVYSLLVFSMILVVILFEDPSSLKVRTAYAIAGLAGTFFINIIRITAIFVTDYFYGTEAGGTIHYIVGYALFSTWLACFFLIYSKRQTIHTKITSLLKT